MAITVHKVMGGESPGLLPIEDLDDEYCEWWGNKQALSDFAAMPPDRVTLVPPPPDEAPDLYSFM